MWRQFLGWGESIWGRSCHSLENRGRIRVLSSEGRSWAQSCGAIDSSRPVFSQSRLAVEPPLWVTERAVGFRCASPPSCSSSVTFIASFLSASNRQLAKLQTPLGFHLYLSHLSQFRTNEVVKLPWWVLLVRRPALLTTWGCVRIEQQLPLSPRSDRLPADNQ